MNDGRFDCTELVDRLKDAVTDRAAEAKRYPEDFENDEYDYWQEQAREISRYAKSSGLHAEVK